MVSKFFTLLLFMLICTRLLGQSGDLMRVMSPSPTSRQFDKFLHHEVSMYNGIPAINIPLYTIQVGKLSIPIELKYHASGVKYGQASGEVGVGWVIEPGYRVSRTMYGRPDEYYSKPVVSDPLYAFSDKYLRDAYLSKFIRTNEMDIYPATDIVDGEYDLFSYSAGNAGGAFIIEDRTLQKVRNISAGLDTIMYTQNVQGMITSFDIMDGSGNAFKFGKMPASADIIYELNSSAVFSKGITPTAWMLTNVQDPFGRYARFAYSTHTEYNNFTPQTVTALSSVGLVAQSCGIFYGGTSTSNIPYSQYTVKRVSGIETEDVKVDFYRAAATGMIDSIVIRRWPDNQKIKKVVFSYWNNSMYTFLGAVSIFGTDASAPQVYSLNYYNQAAPWNGYFAPDYWGYLKKSNMQGYFYPDFGTPQLCTPTAPYAMLEVTGINRNPTVADDAIYYTLNKITYPTGGSTFLEYEPGKYSGYRDDGEGNVKYAGIRLKKSWYSSNSAGTGTEMLKEYQYGVNGDGFGTVAVDLADKRYFASESLTGDCTQDGPTLSAIRMLRSVTFKTVPDEELVGGSFAGSPVHYSKVVEVQRTQAPGGTWIPNGKIEYEYGLAGQLAWYGYSGNSSYFGFNSLLPGLPTADCGGMLDNPQLQNRQYYSYYVARHSPWDKPFLKNKTVYKVENGLEVIAEKEEHEYLTNYVDLPGLKVRRYFSSSVHYTNALDYYSWPQLHSMFDYAMYSVSCGERMISKTTNTNYSAVGNIQVVRNFTYNRHGQAVKEESENSDLSKYITYRQYPADYGLITATDALSAGIKNLIQKRVLAAEIETVTFKTDAAGTNAKAVKSMFTRFKTAAPLPDLIYSLDGAPVTNFIRSAVSGGAVAMDARYNSKIVFLNFDNKGNILEQQKINDVKEVYLWGYNGQYPVAKVIGSDYTTVASYVSSSILNAPASDQVLRTELNKIRTGLAGTTAQVTTMTYAPQVGVTSETDPAGRITFYEYDVFNRLKVIKDYLGRILKQYSYEYQQLVN